MHLGVCHMGAGGSADAMKFSDVLILIGIGILCAGFMMHGWVESVSLESGENAQPYQKSARSEHAWHPLVYVLDGVTASAVAKLWRAVQAIA